MDFCGRLAAERSDYTVVVVTHRIEPAADYAD